MQGTIHQNLDEIYGVEKQKDTTSYAGYYTDDYPEIVIENNNAQNEVRALVLKDSFAKRNRATLSTKFQTHIYPRPASLSRKRCISIHSRQQH